MLISSFNNNFHEYNLILKLLHLAGNNNDFVADFSGANL